MLELTGKGQNWNRVPISGEIRKEFSGESYASTREIARYAKDNGYTGVLIRDITDNGGRGAEAEAGDVYIFFDGANLKSADPVTYDDAGNVIPLSERFNREKDDIRFSREIRSWEEVEAENAELRQRLATRERQLAAARRETTRTTQPTLRDSDVNRAARELVKYSEAGQKEVAAKLKALGKFIMRGSGGNDELTWTEVRDRADEIARLIVGSGNPTG